MPPLGHIYCFISTLLTIQTLWPTYTPQRSLFLPTIPLRRHDHECLKGKMSVTVYRYVTREQRPNTALGRRKVSIVH